MGSEFRVNTYFEDWQENAEVAVFPDGSFVVVWDSLFRIEGASGYFVSGQRYDADGQRNGSEFIIYAADGYNAREASIDILPDGGFVVAFQRSVQFLDDEIWLRLYDADATPRGSAFRADTMPNDLDATTPEVVALEDGGFLLFSSVWGAGVGLAESVFVSRFANDGTRISAEQQLNVNANANGGQFNPFAARLENGNIAVIWDSENSNRNQPNGIYSIDEVRGAILSPNGQVIRSDFSLVEQQSGANIPGEPDLSITALIGGGFAIAWSRTILDGFDSSRQIRWATFDSAGNRTSPDYLATAREEGTPEHASIIQTTDGNIVVSWDYANGIWDDVAARVFRLDGTPLSEEFIVPQNTALEQNLARLAPLNDGQFVAVYNSEDIDPDDEGIAGRIFDAVEDPNPPIDPDPTPEPDPTLVDFAGTAENDTHRGTAASEVFASGAGAFDLMFGGGGADTFVFGDELENDRLERDVIMDFDQQDLLDLDDLEIESALQTGQGIVLIVEGDGDAIYLRGEDLTLAQVQDFIL